MSSTSASTCYTDYVIIRILHLADPLIPESFCFGRVRTRQDKTKPFPFSFFFCFFFLSRIQTTFDFIEYTNSNSYTIKNKQNLFIAVRQKSYCKCEVDQSRTRPHATCSAHQSLLPLMRHWGPAKGS